MSTLPTAKKTKQNLPFKTIREAVAVIQNTAVTESTPIVVTTSSEYQALVRKLSALPKPFALVLVEPRD